LNSSKRDADDAVLDPFEVGAGWFEIILPSLQMRVTDAVPAAYRAKAEFTLTRLKLRDGERVIRWRKSWYDMFLSGRLTLDGLRGVAPLLCGRRSTGRGGYCEAMSKRSGAPQLADCNPDDPVSNRVG
jgi:hypothetical protein